MFEALYWQNKLISLKKYFRNTILFSAYTEQNFVELNISFTELYWILHPPQLLYTFVLAPWKTFYFSIHEIFAIQSRLNGEDFMDWDDSISIELSLKKYLLICSDRGREQTQKDRWGMCNFSRWRFMKQKKSIYSIYRIRFR